MSQTINVNSSHLLTFQQGLSIQRKTTKCSNEPLSPTSLACTYAWWVCVITAIGGLAWGMQSSLSALSPARPSSSWPFPHTGHVIYSYGPQLWWYRANSWPGSVKFHTLSRGQEPRREEAWSKGMGRGDEEIRSWKTKERKYKDLMRLWICQDVAWHCLHVVLGGFILMRDWLMQEICTFLWQQSKTLWGKKEYKLMRG